MRLVIALAAVLSAAAASQIAIASVLARGESVVAVAGGAGEPAVEWDIEITGGTASTDHITLLPVPVGVQAEFSVAVDAATAAVKLRPVLSAERQLANVRCLDDLWPPTEIDPVIDESSFTFDIVGGRRYRCVAASAPIVVGGQAGATAEATAAHLLPRSDASTSPSAPSPGWPAVLVTLVVITGIALLLRPARR